MKIQLHTRKSLINAIEAEIIAYAKDCKIGLTAGIDPDDIPGDPVHGYHLACMQELIDQLPPYDPCTREECAGTFEPLTNQDTNTIDAKECDACRLLVGVDA